MIKTILKVEGMMCGNCEKHVNEAIKKAFAVKSVSSSHISGETVIASENEIPDAELRAVIEDAGYELKGSSVSEI